MSEGWPKGRQLEPIEVFEVTPWRALALFRVATLAYSVILTAHNFNHYPRPYAAWVVIVGMAVWTGSRSPPTSGPGAGPGPCCWRT